MSDLSFFVPLQDVRAEVQRLATVHQNECTPLGMPHVEVIHSGTRADWPGGAYLECQEGPLASGDYGIRIRWSRPGNAGERCWRLSPWCAPETSLVFPGERVRGETRETVGQLTLSEASTVPCSRHPGSSLADCGCKPLAQVMGEDLPDFAAAKAFIKANPVKGWATPPPNNPSATGANAMLPPGDPRGSCDKHGSVCDGGCGYTRHDIPIRGLDVAIGPVWIVQCHPCGDPWESPREEVPDSRCENCGEPVRLLQTPLLVPNERGVETLGRLTDEEHKTSQRGDSLCACQVCGGAIAKGDHFRAPPRSKSGALSRTRRVHALCAKACEEVAS